jgi:hypothetical protein
MRLRVVYSSISLQLAAFKRAFVNDLSIALSISASSVEKVELTAETGTGATLVDFCLTNSDVNVVLGYKVCAFYTL